ncbi:hypothetical protein GALL_331700 [mine drainage metagenome]|uniref:Uncharacterized protein n=1 Tax=mine drainage metagenome TaxID=410659 RepID=A0A1J5QN26_9ZZZZ
MKALELRLRKLEARRAVVAAQWRPPIERAKYDLALDLIFCAIEGRALGMTVSGAAFEAEMAAQGRAIPVPAKWGDRCPPWEPQCPADWNEAERSYFAELVKAVKTLDETI